MNFETQKIVPLRNRCLFAHFNPTYFLTLQDFVCTLEIWAICCTDFSYCGSTIFNRINSFLKWTDYERLLSAALLVSHEYSCTPRLKWHQELLEISRWYSKMNSKTQGNQIARPSDGEYWVYWCRIRDENEVTPMALEGLPWQSSQSWPCSSP